MASMLFIKFLERESEAKKVAKAWSETRLI